MKKEETKIVDLYDLSHTQAADFLRQFTYPWEALAHIKEFILELGKTLPEDEYEKRGETVWVHKTAKVMPSAYLVRISLSERTQRSATARSSGEMP